MASGRTLRSKRAAPDESASLTSADSTAAGSSRVGTAPASASGSPAPAAKRAAKVSATASDSAASPAKRTAKAPARKRARLDVEAHELAPATGIDEYRRASR